MQVYDDINNDGVVDAGDTVVGSEQLGSGATAYGVTVTLDTGANDLLVVATAATDQQSAAADVPTLTYTLPPVLTGGGVPITVQSGGHAVVIDPGVTLVYSGPNLTTASVSIDSNFTSSEDRLLFTNQNGITGSYNSTTGILTLSGSATAAQYQAALRSVEYQDINTNPNTDQPGPAIDHLLGGIRRV